MPEFDVYLQELDKHEKSTHKKDDQQNSLWHDDEAQNKPEILHVRRVVAGNPNTPRQILERLAQDSTALIRERIAENLRTPAEILVKLANDPSSDVRLAVAENPNTPAEVLAYLARDNSTDVRYGVAENPHMPENILLRLAEDENPYIRCRAMKTLHMLPPSVQSRLKILMEKAMSAQNLGEQTEF